MRRWDFCGHHSHRSITSAVWCMMKASTWWTIMEGDFNKGGDVLVTHPRIPYAEPLDEAELKDFNAATIGIQMIDKLNIGVAMRALRKHEGSSVAAAAPRN